MAVAEDGIRAETVSNQYLDADSRLPYDDLEFLAELEWQPPSHAAGEHGAEGSSNHFIDLEPDVDLDAVAWLLVATLRTVHDVEEPEDLLYRCFHANEGRILMPILALSRLPERD